MPHIVFDKTIDLKDFAKKFIPIFQKEPFLVKITTIFVEKNNLAALLPAVVISDTSQQFLIQILANKSKTTIRLYPDTDPKKTNGVKMSMAFLAKQIMYCYPSLQITKTNLSNYLETVIS